MTLHHINVTQLPLSDKIENVCSENISQVWLESEMKYRSARVTLLLAGLELRMGETNEETKAKR